MVSLTRIEKSLIGFKRMKEMTNTFHCTVKSTESCGHYKLAEKPATHKIKTLFDYVTMSPQMLAKKTIGSMAVRDPKSYEGGFKTIFVSPLVTESFDTWDACFEAAVRALEEQYDEMS